MLRITINNMLVLFWGERMFLSFGLFRVMIHPESSPPITATPLGVVVH